MTSEIQAKLIALKAFRLGSHEEDKNEAEKLAKQCLTQLETQSSSAVIIRRKIFYTLFLAEVFRSENPLTYRESAMHLGKKMESMGEANPYPYYIALVEAFEHKYSTGDFGDFNLGCGNISMSYFDYDSNYDCAIGLSRSIWEDYSKFIQIHDLKTIAMFHGIILE
jgi:hypothetical protein